MKINKIKMIENPVEDIALCDENLEILLGGTVCQQFIHGVCYGYEQNAACSSTQDYMGMKCGIFQLA